MLIKIIAAKKFAAIGVQPMKKVAKNNMGTGNLMHCRSSRNESRN
jgi:hypothetical protein